MHWFVFTSQLAVSFVHIVTKPSSDIDECDDIGACANGDCQNTRGGFVCDCNQGFVPVNDNKACEGEKLHV